MQIYTNLYKIPFYPITFIAILTLDYQYTVYCVLCCRFTNTYINVNATKALLFYFIIWDYRHVSYIQGFSSNPQ